MQKRKNAFVADYIVGLVKESEKLGITEEEIMEFIKIVKGSEEA